MALPNQNFTLWQGDSKNIIISVIDKNKLPFPLVGSKIRWGMEKDGNLNYKINKSLDNGIEITGGSEFTVHILSEDTKELPPGVYLHDAEVTDSLGNVCTVCTGKITVYYSVTK